MFHVEQVFAGRLFPDAEASEQRVEHILGGGAAKQAIKANPREPERFCSQQGIRLLCRCLEGTRRFVQQVMLALVERGFPGLWKRLARRFNQVGDQRINTLACHR